MEDYELIRFTASWCSPCRRYAPIFDEFLKEAGIFGSVVDIDESPAIAQKYGIQSVPTTVMVTADGDAVKSETGALSKPKLRTFIEV